VIDHVQALKHCGVDSPDNMQWQTREEAKAKEAAEIADQLVAGAQIKMIGVGEQNSGIEVLGEVALGEPFDRGLRADGHEDGRLDIAVSGMQHTGAGACDRTLGLNLKGDLRPELHLK
jgi:hypothetical protein